MKKTASSSSRAPLFELRHSDIHGWGAFALRRIRKGTRVIEYLGDRISHEEVDERYADKDANDNHTFLFTVDKHIVIDAGVNGNDARFINHSCDPNCESNIEKKRVFIDAIRTIQPGEELYYDYAIGRDDDDDPNVDEIFACRCGAEQCRGSMLEPKPERKRRKRAGRKAAARKRRRDAARGGAARKDASKRGPGAAGRRAAGGHKARPRAAARPTAARAGAVAKRGAVSKTAAPRRRAAVRGGKTRRGAGR